MRHPLRIWGLVGFKLEKQKASIEVIGEKPNARPYVNIDDHQNKTIASIDATQMNGLVSRWMKANGWDHFRNDAGEFYQKIKPPSQRRKK